MKTPSFLQILDSRGNPTIKARYEDTTVAVPSGASTGKHEALELRDHQDAYGGKTVHDAIENARQLANQLTWDPADVQRADEHMLSQENSPAKQRYGANAILANSLLQARLQARQDGRALHELLAELAGTQPTLPTPFANVLNGGEHAGNSLALQEFMIVPHRAQTLSQAVRQVAETTHALKRIIAERYGKSQTSVGDEGGFAPDITDAHEACQLLVDAMQAAGHDMAIAIDAAASEFSIGPRYKIGPDESLTSDELTEWYIALLKQYPIISIEDPFHEDDFQSFATLKWRIGEERLNCQVVGDDLTVTNPDRIRQAISASCCNCLLLKVNQIGTVTESLQAARLAREAGWNVMVSHRSGETTDAFIADLATGLGCGQAKIGAPVRGERTAKYNRLLELEAHYELPFSTLTNL